MMEKEQMDMKNEESVAEYGSLEVVNIRLVKEPSIVSDTPITCNQDAVDAIIKYMSGCDREVFGVLNLSARGTPISFNVASVGTLTESLVSPREIFKAAILSNASACIAFHCHPSGCPEPSQTDIASTQRIQKAGEIMNIKVIDHIIVGCGTGDHISFKARGLMEEGIGFGDAVRENSVLTDLKKDWRKLKGEEQDLKKKIKKLKQREAFER